MVHSTPIRVHAQPGQPSRGILNYNGMTFSCALGRGGISAFKREGDGATPLARMKVVEIFWRGDRTTLPVWQAGLPSRRIRSDMGWCDASGDANYNRLVRLPFKASHETMKRDDRLYNVVVVLDWNLKPRIRGRGSAIFLHIAREGMKPTEGCIAVEPWVMRRLLPLLHPGRSFEVVR